MDWADLKGLFQPRPFCRSAILPFCHSLSAFSGSSSIPCRTNEAQEATKALLPMTPRLVAPAITSSHRGTRFIAQTASSSASRMEQISNGSHCEARGRVGKMRAADGSTGCRAGQEAGLSGPRSALLSISAKPGAKERSSPAKRRSEGGRSRRPQPALRAAWEERAARRQRSGCRHFTAKLAGLRAEPGCQGAAGGCWTAAGATGQREKS